MMMMFSWISNAITYMGDDAHDYADDVTTAMIRGRTVGAVVVVVVDGVFFVHSYIPLFSFLVFVFPLQLPSLCMHPSAFYRVYPVPFSFSLSLSQHVMSFYFLRFLRFYLS